MRPHVYNTGPGAGTHRSLASDRGYKLFLLYVVIWLSRAVAAERSTPRWPSNCHQCTGSGTTYSKTTGFHKMYTNCSSPESGASACSRPAPRTQLGCTQQVLSPSCGCPSEWGPKVSVGDAVGPSRAVGVPSAS